MVQVEWVNVGTLPEGSRPDVAQSFSFNVGGRNSGMFVMSDGRILAMQVVNAAVKPSIKYGERRWGAFA